MKKILVAVDLSDSAAIVIDHAASIASAFKSQVLVLHVETPQTSYLGSEVIPVELPFENEEEIRLIKNDLSSMVEYLKRKGIQSSFELAKGMVAESIVEKAQEFKADLIVLGVHSHGFLYRAIIGSVSSAVLKHSPCPVLVIPEV